MKRELWRAAAMALPVAALLLLRSPRMFLAMRADGTEVQIAGTFFPWRVILEELKITMPVWQPMLADLLAIFALTLAVVILARWAGHLCVAKTDGRVRRAASVGYTVAIWLVWLYAVFVVGANALLMSHGRIPATLGEVGMTLI